MPKQRSVTELLHIAFKAQGSQAEDLQCRSKGCHGARLAVSALYLYIVRYRPANYLASSTLLGLILIAWQPRFELGNLSLQAEDVDVLLVQAGVRLIPARLQLHHQLLHGLHVCQLGVLARELQAGSLQCNCI